MGAENEIPPAVMTRLDNIETQMQKRFDDLMRLKRDVESRSQKAAVDQSTPVAPVGQSNWYNRSGGGARRSQGDPAVAEPSAQNTSLSSGPYHQPNDSRSVAVCWQCREPGHIRRNCPQNEVTAPEANRQTQTVPATRGSGQISRLNPLDMYLKLCLNNKELSCLLNSGCEITMIPKSAIDEIAPYFINRGLWTPSASVPPANLCCK